jgi:hypothetical protein
MRLERRGWVETLTRTFLAWLAVLIFSLLIGLFIALLFLFAAQPSLAHSQSNEPTRAADERQIRRDCTYDALRYCKAAIVTGNRSLIIACMVEHKDKLRPQCAAHLY